MHENTSKIYFYFVYSILDKKLYVHHSRKISTKQSFFSMILGKNLSQLLQFLQLYTLISKIIWPNFLRFFQNINTIPCLIKPKIIIIKSDFLATKQIILINKYYTDIVFLFIIGIPPYHMSCFQNIIWCAYLITYYD